MAREHARLYLKVWEDADFLALSMSEQWAYWALLSSPDLSWCGVAPLLPQRLGMLARDGSPAKAARAIAGLREARFVLVDQDTAEIAIRTFVRHDGVVKQPNVMCAAIKAWGKVHSEDIREAIAEQLARAYAEQLPEGFGEGFYRAFHRSFPEGFPKGFPEGFAKGLPEGYLEGFLEGFANSPSPFPLPPLKAMETSSLTMLKQRARDEQRA